MSFRVVIADSAIADAMEVYAHIHSESPRAADRWFDGLIAACDSLQRFPRRCRVAQDCRWLLGDIRQLAYGGHRILFRVDGPAVHIFVVRHGARRAIDQD